MNPIEGASHTEPHIDASESRLNWLRAAVLGADDGIVSVGALVVGVAGATDATGVIFATGIAGLLAGALSMALGEYVSVSAQRDTERALLAKERQELATEPARELEELTQLYEAKGLSRATAVEVARELSDKDVFGAHVETELHLDPGRLASPWQAAFASAASFCVGALIPLATIVLPPAVLRLPLTFVAVILALAFTGAWSASVGGAGKMRATLRVVIGGTLAMVITYGVGILFGVSGV
jgi:VIT1/CCC1 family predicted Fe2+/Mn2+ transporter